MMLLSLLQEGFRLIRSNSIFLLRMAASPGFSLIEVMIALVVLAAGLLGLMAMQVVSIRGNVFSTEMTYASFLAQKEFEELRDMDYDSVVNDTKIIPASELTKGVAYTITRTVSDNTPTDDMKTVELEIKWKGVPAGSTTGGSPVEFKTRFCTVIYR